MIYPPQRVDARRLRPAPWLRVGVGRAREAHPRLIRVTSARSAAERFPPASESRHSPRLVRLHRPRHQTHERDGRGDQRDDAESLRSAFGSPRRIPVPAPRVSSRRPPSIPPRSRPTSPRTSPSRRRARTPNPPSSPPEASSASPNSASTSAASKHLPGSRSADVLGSTPSKSTRARSRRGARPRRQTTNLAHRRRRERREFTGKRARGEPGEVVRQRDAHERAFGDDPRRSKRRPRPPSRAARRRVGRRLEHAAKSPEPRSVTAGPSSVTSGSSRPRIRRGTSRRRLRGTWRRRRFRI